MFQRSKNRTKPYKGLSPRGKSNRSKNRQAWQREMLALYGYGKPCAICGSTLNSFNAHRLKKTRIVSKDEYVHGRVPLCGFHHTALDEATGDNVHEMMFLTISNLMEIVVESPEADEMWERVERLGLGAKNG